MQHHPHRILGHNLKSDGRVQYLVMKCMCSSFYHHTDVKNSLHINWAPEHFHLLWAAAPLRGRDTKGGKDSSSVTGSTSRSTRKNGENCQAHGICGMLCYLKFLQRRRKMGQTLTITIFYYITINRSSTVWQKNDKFQITSQHILLKTLKILKQTVVFFFFPFFNLMSGMTNIPRSHNQIMEKLDHTAYVPHQIKHNVQNVHVSVYTIQK